MMQVIYDDSKDRLMWFIRKQKMGSSFWDKHWSSHHLRLKEWVKSSKPHLILLLISIFTRRKKNLRILEAGCGLGQIVYHLSQFGYNIEGIDFAQKTIRAIKENFPELSVRVEDVKNIKRPDNYYDIYISLGVIEHFKEGPAQILDEMERVTKRNGYIILSVPSISLLRRIKIKLKKYKRYKEIIQKQNGLYFYQYAFSVAELKKMFREKGLKIVFTFPWSGIKGLKDEVIFLRPLVERIDSISTHSTIGLIVKRIFDILFASFASHIRYFILRIEK